MGRLISSPSKPASGCHETPFTNTFRATVTVIPIIKIGQTQDMAKFMGIDPDRTNCVGITVTAARQFWRNGIGVDNYIRSVSTGIIGYILIGW